MISFEKTKESEAIQTVTRDVAEKVMRPRSRFYDENENEIPWDYINYMNESLKKVEKDEAAKRASGDAGPSEDGVSTLYQTMVHRIEMLGWGDAGLYLCTPRRGLGASAIEAQGTPEQKKRFLSKLHGEKPAYGAMAITEAAAGSDNSAIVARAVFDEATDEWILNGEKIFVTSGRKALIDTDGFVVVWATIDPAAGRAGIRSFVVEAGTAGISVSKKEEKLGIRASDTVSLILEDCRIPAENMLGSSDKKERTTEDFKGAMRTFNVTRPFIAALALGIGRAALEEVKARLAEQGVEIRYGLPRQKMTNIEREVIDMERQHRAAWLLTMKAVWLSDMKRNNILDSAMSKLYAGEVVTRITQKAVEIMGPLGFSRESLLEKWFRDAKINDIFEGTGQINRLVAARQIFGYRGRDLR